MQMNGVSKNVDHFCQLQRGNETKHMCHSHLNSCKMQMNNTVGKHYESSSITDLQH